MPPFTAPDDLALYYSPVLRLHPNEQWREEGVDEFFSRSPGLVASSHQCPLPTRWRTLETDGAGMPCGALALSDPDTPVPVKSMPHVFVGGTVYPIRRKVAPITGSPVADNTHWVIEYWLFYPFDRWAVPHSAFGSLRQGHQGDWEVVVVGLDARYSPLFVAYSAHCGGVWRPWDTAPVVSLPEDTPPPLVTLTSPRPRAWTVTVGPDGHHPLVVVARGSHANYASTGSREPDWGSCELGPRASNALRLASFAGSVTEQTPRFGVIQVPAVAKMKVAERIASLPWWWGRGEEVTLSGLLISSSHHGPGSPSFAEEHPIWDDPLGVIFGGGHWSEEPGYHSTPSRTPMPETTPFVVVLGHPPGRIVAGVVGANPVDTNWSSAYHASVGSPTSPGPPRQLRLSSSPRRSSLQAPTGPADSGKPRGTVRERGGALRSQARPRGSARAARLAAAA
jgi:hypothetical protein